MNDVIGPTGRNVIGMHPPAFAQLCDLLRREGGLKPTRRSTVEEQVAKTLNILTRQARSREVGFWFKRSGETTHRHFYSVLKAILKVEHLFIRQPDGSVTPHEIQQNNRYYPYFKDCVGAIDGTHIRAKVPGNLATRYRGRKEFTTMNVLCSCTFDLKFTYVLSGWEGTASDSRILRDARSREHQLEVPEGKYYIADAGFGLKAEFITPYRGVRYHLKEFTNNAPRNARELFNLRHASLRNVIERAFGVLKKRFPIISSGNEPTYFVKTHKYIVLACCILHNFLLGVDPDEELLSIVDEQIRRRLQRRRPTTDEADDRRGEIIRDEIAAQMWLEYSQHHA